MSSSERPFFTATHPTMLDRRDAVAVIGHQEKIAPFVLLKSLGIRGKLQDVRQKLLDSNPSNVVHFAPRSRGLEPIQGMDAEDAYLRDLSLGWNFSKNGVMASWDSVRISAKPPFLLVEGEQVALIDLTHLDQTSPLVLELALTEAISRPSREISPLVLLSDEVRELLSYSEAERMTLTDLPKAPRT